MRILVADDQAFWRKALEESLLEHGYRPTCVESAEKAWQVLQNEPDVSMLVTDWVMPGISGPELCRRARQLPRRSYLPILLMTSRAGREDLVAALEAGADAFLRKPFDEPELLAQIRVAERILALEMRLEHQIADLRAAQDRIDRDLAQAATTQRAFVPEAPPAVPGVEFAWAWESCDRLGGDLFNIVRLSENHVGLHVLDVSGHGTSAALHSVSLSHVLHPVPQQGGILKRVDATTGAWLLASPAEVACELDRRFPLIERSGHYATFLYGVLELDSRRFRYVRAGHPGPIHVSNGRARACNEGGGVPIGVESEEDYVDQEIELAPGDSLLLLSDGVLEARAPDGSLFGLERTLDVAASRSGHGIRATLAALEEALASHRQGDPPGDDVTVVGLRLS